MKERHLSTDGGGVRERRRGRDFVGQIWLMISETVFDALQRLKVDDWWVRALFLVRLRWIHCAYITLCMCTTSSLCPYLVLLFCSHCQRYIIHTRASPQTMLSLLLVMGEHHVLGLRVT